MDSCLYMDSLIFVPRLYMDSNKPVWLTAWTPTPVGVGIGSAWTGLRGHQPMVMFCLFVHCSGRGEKITSRLLFFIFRAVEGGENDLIFLIISGRGRGTYHLTVMYTMAPIPIWLKSWYEFGLKAQ